MLIYTFLMVELVGRNRQTVAGALAEGNAEFVQEFNREKHVKPTDPTVSVIELIKVTMKDSASAVTEAEKMADISRC